MSILLSSLAGAREQGRKVVCLSQVRQLAIVHDFYTKDWRGMLPHYDFWLWWPDPSKPNRQIRVPESGELFGRRRAQEGRKYEWGRPAGANYAVTAEIYKCPSDRGERRNPTIPEDKRPPATFSYSRNRYVMDVMRRMGLWTTVYDSAGRPFPSPYMPMDKPKRPSQTPLLVEEHETSALNDGYCFPIDDVNNVGSTEDFLSMRHANRVVLAFHDLHADAARSKDFNTTLWSPMQHNLLAPGLPPIVPAAAP